MELSPQNLSLKEALSQDLFSTYLVGHFLPLLDALKIPQLSKHFCSFLS